MGGDKNRTERNYGLEKILHRIRCSVWFHLPVWLLLVPARAHGAHQEVPALWRTEADFGNHFSTLIFWAHCDGILPHASLCTFCPWRWPRRMRDACDSDRADICRRLPDYFRGTAADDQDPLRLDCWRLDPILGCRRNHRRDLQARFANDPLGLNPSQL